LYVNKEIGNIGEEIATNFLKNEGYKILENNFRCNQGEIDIIAKDKKEIVFVEVKTRTNTKFGFAAEAVDNIKQKHIKSSAEYYIYINNLYDEFIRFDVIEVYINKYNFKINHIKII
jgi:putative endonuclease